VGPDEVARQPGRTQISPAVALRPIEGVGRAAAMLEVPLAGGVAEKVRIARALHGLSHEWAVGRPATFCLLAENARHQTVILRLP